MYAKKSVAILLTVATLTIGVCGCMDMVNERIENRISVQGYYDESNVPRAYIPWMDYLINKYDDSFTYSGVASEKRTIIVRSEKYPHAMILVNRFDDGSFSDNYAFFVFEEQTFAFIFELLTEVMQTDLKLHLHVPLFGRYSFPVNVTFDEYIISREAGIAFAVVMPPDFIIENRDVFANTLADELVRNGLKLSGGNRVYFADTWECYNDFDNLSWENFLRKYNNQTKMLYFSMFFSRTNDVEFSWREASN